MLRLFTSSSLGVAPLGSRPSRPSRPSRVGSRLFARAASVAAVGSVLALVACESSSSSEPMSPIDGGQTSPVVPGSDSGGEERDAATAADTGAGDAGATCNDVAQLGAHVDYVSSTTPAETPAGGTVIDGTYVLTKFVIHTPAFADGTVLLPIGKTTAVIGGGTMRIVLTDPQGAVKRTNETLTLAGMAVTTASACTFPQVDAAAAPRTGKFTATATTFTIFLDTPNGPIVNEYTKM